MGLLGTFLSAKEKELANYQELHGKERKLSYELYLKVLFISKVLTYLVLIWWFWRVPVASKSQQLVQPFGNAFLLHIYLLSPILSSCMAICKNLLFSSLSLSLDDLSSTYYNACFTCYIGL
ncbi:unnamed protein product [Prunus brigantina]